MTRDHKLFLNWLINYSLIVFFFYVMWDKGLISEVLFSDKSFITTIILFLFITISIHCGINTFYISRELNKAHVIKKNLPLIVHTRSAESDTYEILKKANKNKLS